MNKRTLILIGIALLLAGGIYWYSRDDTSDAPLSVNTAPMSPSQLRFETLLRELKPITFNAAIFTDPRFLSLIDISQPVTPETFGRADPFAPVPGLSE